MKKALICGISGQDGAISTTKRICGIWHIQRCTDGIFSESDAIKQVSLESMSMNDFRSVLQVLAKVKPDEVYNLAGQSSVGLSFEQPVETMESISVGTLNLLEAIRFTNLPIKFYNAGSGECFGNTLEPADENTPFRPRSPYAVAKAAAFWEVANYRESYELFACSGILSNHESPLRPERFVTRKIVAAACRIADGSPEKLNLGNISIQRDWGWAPEYVEAMWLMLQQEKADDYVIATGETHSLEEFVATAFSVLELNQTEHVTTDESLLRPTDLAISMANPEKAKEKLGWVAKHKMKDVVKNMIEEEMKLLRIQKK